MKLQTLPILLHEGHEQTETATSTATSVTSTFSMAGSELIVVSVIGVLLIGAILGYAIKK